MFSGCTAFQAITQPSKLKKTHYGFGHTLSFQLLNPNVYLNGDLIHMVPIIGTRFSRNNFWKKLQSNNFLSVQHRTWTPSAWVPPTVCWEEFVLTKGNVDIKSWDPGASSGLSVKPDLII